MGMWSNEGETVFFFERRSSFFSWLTILRLRLKL